MKLITRQSKANEAAGHWQYGARERENIYNALIALGDSPNPDDVDRVIGNKSWTEVGECDECRKASEALIMLGEEPDYDSHTAYICINCLQSAMIKINSHKRYKEE
jgi:hypothetical protein